MKETEQINKKSRRLRRFSPQELKEFQTNRELRPEPVDRENVPHIVFPKECRLVSDLPMTHEQMKAASELMYAGVKVKEASERFLKAMPENTCFQFYGDYGILKIKEKQLWMNQI